MQSWISVKISKKCLLRFHGRGNLKNSAYNVKHDKQLYFKYSEVHAGYRQKLQIHSMHQNHVKDQ